MRVDFTVLYFVCLMFSSFEMKLFRVSPYHCPNAILKNGKSRLLQKGKYIKFTCNAGYMMLGNRLNICIRGKWDAPPPKCIRPGCRKIYSKPLLNGVAVPSHMDAAIHFYCSYGYQLNGAMVTYCNGTTWSDYMPTCLPRGTRPELSCDFEKPDICGWTHDLNHDFEWIRMQYNTPSGIIGTGPSFDHTYGEGRGGYYMYIESSSKNPNDTARLVSPIYEKTNTTTCFKFYYHMYGATIGTLRVYLRLVNETMGNHPHHAFFEKHGNQGNRWIEYAKVFQEIPKDYQIIIEGVRGNSHVSDIAVDDVSIIEDCTPDLLMELYTTSTEIEEEMATTELMPDDLLSCEDRCYQTSIIMVGHHRKCGCDANCYSRNDCCPDYFDFCVLQGNTSMDSDYTSTISISSSPNPEKSINIETTTQYETEATTEAEKIFSTTRQTTHRTVEEITKKHTVKTVETTKSTMNIISPTTSTIKIIPTTIKTKTERNNRRKKPKRPIFKSTTDLSNDIPQIPDDMVPIEDVAHLKRRFNEKIVFSTEEEENNLTLYLGLCGIVVITSVFVAVFMRRKRRSRSFRSASHGDSASDVRFLTSDELLDLNLDYE